MAVSFAGNLLDIEPSESLLDAATRAGQKIPSSCRSGICQTCLVKVAEGDIPKAAQQGLSENQKVQQLALACQLVPESSLDAHPLGHTNQHVSTVRSHQVLNNSVLRLQLDTELRRWEPGQFISIWKDADTARPYSIASLKEEGGLELHIKLHEQGAVSRWLHHDIKPGDQLFISDPRGGCFYVPDHAEKNLLLAGTGTGLAPLIGIAKQALRQGHEKPIYLYLGGRDPSSFYLQEELNALAEQHNNFHYIPVLREDHGSPYVTGELLQTIQAAHPKLHNWCVFLCGAPDLVRKMQKACFLNGAKMTDIHADPFITS